MKRVELLAPAGDYQAFLGAVSAGADAVYLGGTRFGARAYAANLTGEEIEKAVRYAHLWDRKVYLTLNTLLKQSEMAELEAYLSPLYACGLDGVIVQDLGVASCVRRRFPDLPLHISTQAGITGRYGARLMKELGASRVIPARELSLDEIRAIVREGLEVETFVHGAICYCYSGQCLLSSTLGGRSGNRGRCAQPCRLPYEAASPAAGRASRPAPQYPLSMKDLCAVSLLPQLIEAGIASFKIEGRMKKPEYAAGVTAIYRKYIDRYYAAPDRPLRVEPEDLEALEQLYVRDGLQDGYYRRRRGREMISLSSPGYRGTQEALAERIRSRYLSRPLALPAEMTARFLPGEAAELTVRAKGVSVTVRGQIVQEAKTRALTASEIEKQLRKTGDTPFSCAQPDMQIGQSAFLPVSALNALRREALAALEERLAEAGRRRGEAAPDAEAGSYRETPPDVQQNVCGGAVPSAAMTGEKGSGLPAHAEKAVVRRQERGSLTEMCSPAASCRLPQAAPEPVPARLALAAEVTDLPQAQAALRQPGLSRLYLPGEVFLQKEAETLRGLLEARRAAQPSFALYAALPYVLRAGQEKALAQELQRAADFGVCGVLVRSLEEIGWLRETGWRGGVQADAGLYVWNREARRALSALLAGTGGARETMPPAGAGGAGETVLPAGIGGTGETALPAGSGGAGETALPAGAGGAGETMPPAGAGGAGETALLWGIGGAGETTLPLELSGRELAALAEPGQELIVYGRAPLMVSANCVRDTLAACRREAGEKPDLGTAFFWLRDRKRRQFPVRTDCRHCYNILYNSVPTSLHGFMDEIRRIRPSLRAVFTTESGEETERILSLFSDLAEGGAPPRQLPFSDYTGVSYRRGVE